MSKLHSLPQVPQRWNFGPTFLQQSPTSPEISELDMTTVMASTPGEAPAAKAAPVSGHRKNGKQWHETRKAFRPTSGQTPYAKRAAKNAQEAEVKKLETEMKAEKEEERQHRIQAIKDKRAAKEEKERFEKMALKMHAKRVERVRRREKRNKLLKS
ncbi:rRNA-processing protein cgr1 [Elasticomyces elasticus]|nr:rRNA-processing protein cgr1 [Elasticomyces elasticus]KAK5748551.1 rRNA-processing protein cgr1 [Elasticomyces elasticus]